MRIAFVHLIAAAVFAEPALTIYNQNFAVVRDTVALDLKAGANHVQYTDATPYLEPDSVALRDPSGKLRLRILEQSYRANPVSTSALLAHYEGQTIDFLAGAPEKTEIVSGRIISAGESAYPDRFSSSDQNRTPVIEVAGKLRLGLPGAPLFPALPAGFTLKPSLDWIVYSPAPARLNAELAYITAGMNWQAAYNIVQTGGDRLEMAGWVSIENHAGKSFERARITLMAGDLNKVMRPDLLARQFNAGALVGGAPEGLAPSVTQKSFDQYHLYSLPMRVTLHDKESKQIEFLQAENIRSDVIYVYDGLRLDRDRMGRMPAESWRMDLSLGVQSTNKVWVMREFANTAANGLGIPLPKGRIRFYRRDSDAQLVFTGEDVIDHTPTGASLRVFTGAAFDITGERRRTSHRIDSARSMLDEAFEIKVWNRKTESVEVCVVEHLYRWNAWEIVTSSLPFVKRDADTIEFRLPLEPGQEKSLTYAVHYTW